MKIFKPTNIFVETIKILKILKLTAKSKMLKPRPSSPLCSSIMVVSGSQNPVPGTGDRTLRLESVSGLPT